MWALGTRAASGVCGLTLRALSMIHLLVFQPHYPLLLTHCCGSYQFRQGLPSQHVQVTVTGLSPEVQIFAHLFT